ncbi:general substrate transporter [Polychaeton citri CBS 116435]|uniref:General substrate transporter n=1 Tax=Polychaeton citri CBS 116435 TaxID=1314669 RepID=A0A9P4UUK9_9PEZI|nr:general substrate transporter [Polychaeton citri CBS 116435]
MIARSPQLVGHNHPTSSLHSTRPPYYHSTRGSRRQQQQPRRSHNIAAPSPRSGQSLGTLSIATPPAPPTMSGTSGQSTATFKGLTPHLVYLLVTCTLGPLLFGYHLAELNAPQDVITCKRKAEQLGFTVGRVSAWINSSADSPGRPAGTTKAVGGTLPQCILMNPTQFGAVSSLFTLGGLIGALSAGPLSSSHGRLKTMLYTSIFFSAGPVLEALAPNIATITIGRFVSGIGAGAAMVAVPIYISEIAPPGKKGLFGSYTQVMVNFGIFIAQLLGMFLSRGQLWRIILAVAGFIGILMGLGLLLGGLESPRWMADNGKPSQARRALRKIRAGDIDIAEEVEGWGTNEDSHDVDDEEEALLAHNDEPRNRSTESASTAPASARKSPSPAIRKTVGAFAVLSHPESRTAVLAVAGVMIAQQLCGINSIVMYGVGLLASLFEANSALINVIVSVINVIVTAACAPLVERLGRKTCLLMSISGMGTSSILLALGIMKHVPILSAIAVLAFVASFGLGLGPVPFILASELVGSEAVGATQSWALAANWVATFMVAQFFPILNEAMPKGTIYFIFAGFAVLFGTFVAIEVPETKGKKDADEVWGRDKAAERQD